MRTKLHLASLFLLVEACALAQLAPCASGLYAIAPPGTAGQVALSCVVFPAAPAAKDDALMSDGKAGLVYTDGKGRAVKAWVGAGLFISPQSDGTVFLNNSGVAGHTCSGPSAQLDNGNCLPLTNLPVAAQGAAGPQGPAGPAGPTGPQGATGPQGPAISGGPCTAATPTLLVQLPNGTCLPIVLAGATATATVYANPAIATAAAVVDQSPLGPLQ